MNSKQIDKELKERVDKLSFFVTYIITLDSKQLVNGITKGNNNKRYSKG